jgi:hypothetical protein
MTPSGSWAEFGREGPHDKFIRLRWKRGSPGKSTRSDRPLDIGATHCVSIEIHIVDFSCRPVLKLHSDAPFDQGRLQ